MPFEYHARHVRTVDADTVELDLDLGFGVWRRARRPTPDGTSTTSYRLARIDAPERNTGPGQTARTVLDDLLLKARSIVVQTFKADNFGRYIIELYADGQNVSDWLVANGHAVYQTY